jgi:hypothetical protein
LNARAVFKSPRGAGSFAAASLVMDRPRSPLFLFVKVTGHASANRRRAVRLYYGRCRCSRCSKSAVGNKVTHQLTLAPAVPAVTRNSHLPLSSKSCFGAAKNLGCSARRAGASLRASPSSENPRRAVIRPDDLSGPKHAPNPHHSVPGILLPSTTAARPGLGSACEETTDSPAGSGRAVLAYCP